MSWLLKKKKAEMFNKEEAESRLLDVESIIRQLKQKWTTFDHLKIVVMNKEEKAPSYEEALGDFWSWIALEDDRKRLLAAISKKG